jgi:hypothetical protein
MDIKVTINSKEVKAMFNELLDMGDEMMDDGYPVLKKATPEGRPSTWQSPPPKGYNPGNARRNTVHKSSAKIESRYPYADRLNTGWSKQAPNGFTEPTLKHMEDFVDKFTRRVQK